MALVGIRSRCSPDRHPDYLGDDHWDEMRRTRLAPSRVPTFGRQPIAFLLHSPFLVIYSLVYFPIFLIMCWAEEHDLFLRYGDAYARYWLKTGAFFPKRLK